MKAKEEAEDVAQEMAELRYQITGLLEEERKRRACIEQISLQRISELEAQVLKSRYVNFFKKKFLLKIYFSLVLIKIKKDRRKRISSVRLIHEA